MAKTDNNMSPQQLEEERQRRILQEQWGQALARNKKDSNNNNDTQEEKDADETVATTTTDPKERHYNLYDGRALAYYMVQQLQFIDPLNRRDLTRDELLNLDHYLRRHGFVHLNVTEAYDAKGITLSTAGAAAHTAAGRAQMLQQEANVLLQALFQGASVTAVRGNSNTNTNTNSLARQYQSYAQQQQHPPRQQQQQQSSQRGAGLTTRNRRNNNNFITFTSTRVHQNPDGSMVHTITTNGNAEGRMRTVVMQVPPGMQGNIMTLADERILQMLLQHAYQSRSGGDHTATNIDQMSYDELLERFGVGTEHRRGASPETIQSIPLVKLEDEAALQALPDHQRTCNICLEDFVVGDSVRKLVDCTHVFHPACLDRWLQRVASCPICKTEVHGRSDNETTS
mmetsp:Transcript_19135/g.38701  ORF Transcript_19135/g.38701 Transcript_19135/m.38701 type:complete len:398 (+) Transcript_19135:525-1718(+)